MALGVWLWGCDSGDASVRSLARWDAEASRRVDTFLVRPLAVGRVPTILFGYSLGAERPRPNVESCPSESRLPLVLRVGWSARLTVLAKLASNPEACPAPAFREESLVISAPIPFRIALALSWIGFVLPSVAFAAPDSPPDVTSKTTVLSRVRYLSFGEEKTATGEVIFEEPRPGRRSRDVRLRLFSDRLGDYYSIMLAPDDLIHMDPLGKAETKKILAGWEVTRAKRKEERAAAAKLRAERAKERKKKSGRDDTKKRRKSDDEKSDAKRVPGRVRVEPRSTRESVKLVRRELRPLQDRAREMSSWLERELSEVETLRERDALDSKSRSALNEYRFTLRGARNTLEDAQKVIQQKADELEVLADRVDSREITAAELETRADWIVVRLEKANRNLGTVEEQVAENRGELARLEVALTQATQAMSVAARGEGDFDGSPPARTPEGSHSSDGASELPEPSTMFPAEAVGGSSQERRPSGATKSTVSSLAPRAESASPGSPSEVKTGSKVARRDSAEASQRQAGAIRGESDRGRVSKEGDSEQEGLKASDWILLVTGILVAVGGLFVFLAARSANVTRFRAESERSVDQGQPA